MNTKRHYHRKPGQPRISLEQRCKDAGTWTEPPPDVPRSQWADAILRGNTERYLPLPPKTVSDEDYEKIQRELYGSD